MLSCEGQAGLGHEVHLAFGPIYGPEGSLLERVERFRAAGGARIQTHVVPRLVRPIHPIADARCYFELRALIRELGPDIVHTHSSKAGILGRAAAWAESQRAHGRGQRIGVVHTVHGPPFHAYQSRALNGVYIVCERFAAKRCHVIVSVADAMTRQYLEAGIGGPEQYETVYSGIEAGRFLVPSPGESRGEVRERLGLSESDFVIGTVARLAELKGHDDLLDALGDDLRADPDLKLLWVGDGWWKDRLMGRIERMGLSGSVRTTGLVPPERIPGLIRAMDVLAHPSYREGLPRTVPEALLAGVAVVAYDVDGTGEACREMETGRLVRPGDLEGLREAVRWMRANPEKRAELTERGEAWCVERFPAERMVEHLERVYERALRAAG